jgi:hypothetical protein
MTPKVSDDDRGEITVSLAGKELRGWSYANEAERRQKMLMAREYVEGYADASSTLEYVYRAIDYGFEYGVFDFSILKDEAAQFVRLSNKAAENS